nr:hypothetical protein [Methanobrevibacter arboriphilus]
MINLWIIEEKDEPCNYPWTRATNEVFLTEKGALKEIKKLKKIDENSIYSFRTNKIKLRI